jgi:AsmA protein
VKKIIIRIFKITGFSIAGFLLLLFLAPICFPGTVTEKIKTWTNNSLDGELNFSKVRLSFFKHFPSLTVTLYDFTLKGSAPYKKDTLVNAGEIALGVNVKSLIFEKSIRINKIFVSDALINVKVDEKGAANYNVYVSTKKKDSTAVNDTSSAGLKLEKIIIENSHLVYNDLSVPILINAKGFNYSGSGDLSKAIFDLQSHAKIDSLDFTLSNESYLINKKIEADLITKINTNSLSFLFQKNLLHINKLPVAFEGKMDFLPNGYDLDFSVSSLKSDLHDFITALPPQYLNWLEKTTVKGTTDILLTLKGKYMAASNSSPDLSFNMNIKNGLIAYQGAVEPATNLHLNFETKIPKLNADSMQVKLDSLFFNVGKDYFNASIHTIGLTAPHITSNINCSIDLEKLDKAIGIENVNLKGIYHCNFNADGIYRKGPNPTSLRHEIITLSIPHFSLQTSLQNGYIKYDSLPIAINNISFNLNSTCKSDDYKNSSITIENLSANAGNNFVKGHASVNSIRDMLLDANIQSVINLSDIRKMIPVTGLELAGLLKLDINSKGKIDAGRKTFPQTTAAIQLDNGSIKTDYYPHPIENINLTANAADANGSLKDLQLNIQTASFQFEGKPFTIEAALKNFDDINYNIKAKGELDLGKIYLVFAQKGTSVTGFVKADLSLQGRQSDAMNGRYNKLNNQGVLELRDIRTEHENFPQAFIIKRGVFTFKQDKVWFTDFKAGYGQSDFSMSGYLQNIIEYGLNGKGKLKGNFSLTSEYLNADEFMAFAAVKDSVQRGNIKNQQNATGVIIIPSNLDLQLQANARKLAYNGLEIKNAKANLTISSGSLTLKETGFNLIGCDVTMDAVYGSMSPIKAYFDYKLKATDFDIRKAYNEVKLFHDMASSAGKAQGIVSLDYALKGKLDANMHPVYPSLEGGGVLSIKNVKLAGFKLFNAVAKKTGKDSLSNPDLNKVDIKTTVKNNIIKIERFKMKIAGFRPRIEGETSFDGRINLKMRLGLPPLGIIGIPMHITGTQENPKIKLGKGDNEEIPETEEKDK